MEASRPGGASLGPTEAAPGPDPVPDRRAEPRSGPAGRRRAGHRARATRAPWRRRVRGRDAFDGKEAAAAARERDFDVIVSDIAMPEMNGIELLARRARARPRRAVHAHDRRARRRERRRRRWSTARCATSSSRSRREELEEVVARAVRLHQMARIKREALEMFRIEGKHLGDRAGLEARFASALEHAVDRLPAHRVVVAAQRRSPTRRWSATRSRRCARRPICSRRPSGWGGCRSSGASSAIGSRSTLDEQPIAALLFVNLHAMELDDDSLFRADAPLSRHAETRRPGDHRARAAGADPRRHRARRAAARARLPHRGRRSGRRLRGADQLRAPRARGREGRHVADPRASTARR